MNYELKDKINITKEFLNELGVRGWQEIEHLQAQIANLADNTANDRLRQLLKNLLTSYYVFTGGIEALSEEPIEIPTVEEPTKEPTTEAQPEVVKFEDELSVATDDFTTENIYNINNSEIAEPFEYFVDFDEPIGEPLTDKDLYNN